MKKSLLFVWCFLMSAVAVNAATRNIVPRTDGAGSVGTAAKQWGDVYAVTYHGSGAALTGIPGPDNLGNHIATTTLQMGVYGINTSSTINAGYFVGDGSELTSIPGDNLGDHTATQALEMDGYDIKTSSGITGLAKIVWSDGTVQVSSPAAGGGGGGGAITLLSSGTWSGVSITDIDFVGLATHTVVNVIFCSTITAGGPSDIYMYFNGDYVQTDYYSRHVLGGGTAGSRYYNTPQITADGVGGDVYQACFSVKATISPDGLINANIQGTWGPVIPNFLVDNCWVRGTTYQTSIDQIRFFFSGGFDGVTWLITGEN